jgi:glycosyltransferase involved in cell wall biosynthesis
MRILHVAEAFGGGLMRMVEQVAQGSVTAGHEVLVLHGRRPETPPRPFIDARVKLAALPGDRRRVAQQVGAWRIIRRVVEEWQPDVVHLHSSVSGVVGAAAVGDAVPTIFTPNCFASALDHTALVRAAYRAAERFACRHATVVGAVSWSEAELARSLGARRVVRVPNGVGELDTGGPALPAEHARNGTPRIVAVGRLVAQQRPEATARLLAATADVAAVSWLGGGGGAPGDAAADAVRAAGVPVSGWLPREDVLRRLRGATACLHWSAWDGLSLAVLEAVALDVAVVASDISPNREVLGRAGVCATEDEARRLLRRLVLEPELAAALRRDQRRHAAAFGARAMIEGWLALYEDVAAGRGVGR